MSLEQEVESLRRSLTRLEQSLAEARAQLDLLASTKPWTEYYGRLALFWDDQSEDNVPIGGTVRYLSRVVWTDEKGLRFFARDLFRRQLEIPHGWKHCKVLTKQTEAVLRLELDEGPSEAEV